VNELGYQISKFRWSAVYNL